MTLHSDKGLAVILPEKPRQIYGGFSSGDCIGFITALPVGNLWKTSRPGCQVDVNCNSFVMTMSLCCHGRKEKVEILGTKRTVSADPITPAQPPADNEETVFSCSLSPAELYQELVASYSATCVVDVSPGQGELLKACLATRTKVVAVVGSDAHGSRLELLLTDYILSELSREGSTFFRPESLQKDDQEDEGKEDEETAKKKNRLPPRRPRATRARARATPRRKKSLAKERRTLRRRATRRRRSRTRRRRRPPRRQIRRRSRRRLTKTRRTPRPICGEGIGARFRKPSHSAG